MKKKILALLLVAIMVIGLVPVSAFAALADHAGHDLTIMPGKAATCTKSGLEDGWWCDTCKTIAQDQKYIAPGHTWSYTEIPTTGKHSMVCTGCGATAEENCTGCDFTDCALCGSDLLGIHPMDETGHCVGCQACLSPAWELKYDANNHWWECPCGEKYEPVPHTFGEDGICTYEGCEAEELKSCNHPNMQTTVVPATCYEAGYTVYACPDCGESFKHDGDPALNHPNMEETVVAPTCYKAGYTEYYCPDCDETFKHEGDPALNHPNIKKIVVDATCYEGGYTKYECPDCGDSFIHDETEALNHPNMKKEVVAPTCYKEGYTLYSCDACGESFKHDVVPALNHPNMKKEVVAPTCFEEGYTLYSCPDCGESFKHDVVAANGKHGETYTITKMSDCTDKGYEKVICKACGETVSEKELPLDDTQHYFYNGKCMKCGESEKCLHESGATYTFTKEANCSEEGVVETYCKDCEALLSSETLEKNGNHFFYNGVCQLCGAKDECKHDYVVVREQAADCTNPAYKWYKCSICGNEKNGEEGAADPKAHDYKVVKELAPTCVEAGYVWKKCSICGAEKNHEEGAATGIHNYEVVKELAPTCVEAGYVWKECSVCGWEKNHEQGEATGVHTYEVVKELAPTCVEAGYVWKECSVCGWEKNHEQGEATGVHTWKKDVTEATCTEPGLIQSYCEICGEKSPLSAQTPALGHDVKDGACTRCDYVEPTKPTEPEETTKPSEPEETTKPTEPEATTKPTEKPTEAPTEAPTTKPAETTKPADPALDKVPQTGDNTGMILATMTGIALLSALAFVFGKKRIAG